MKKIKLFAPKAVAALLAAMIIAAFSGCGEPAKDRLTNLTTAAPTTTVSPYVTNPLTGLDMPRELQNTRPAAVMINNIKVAQDVQTAVGSADIVYETLVEGGITRLMAVFSNIGAVDQIGTIRSARYSYSELCDALDARLIHCGSDNKYNTPFMREIGLDNIDIEGNGEGLGERVKNGHDYEHTLYTYGSRIAEFMNKGRTEKRESAKNIYRFNSASSPAVYTDVCRQARVKFSDSYSTVFRYNADKKQYARCDRSGDEMIDFKTEKGEYFTNVFVLFTDVYALSDGVHMRSKLDEGSGYYITQGSVTEIDWKKGDSRDPLKFYQKDGAELRLNCGNSYVCITDSDFRSATKLSEA